MTLIARKLPEIEFVPLITELLSLAQAQWNSTTRDSHDRKRNNKSSDTWIKASRQMLCAPFAGSDPNQHIRRRRWLRLDRSVNLP